MKHPKRPKYIEGAPIRDINALLKQDIVYFQGKLVSKGWFMNWHLNFIMTQLSMGTIRYAI